jgi:hypothetical protein
MKTRALVYHKAGALQDNQLSDGTARIRTILKIALILISVPWLCENGTTRRAHSGHRVGCKGASKVSRRLPIPQTFSNSRA